MVSIEVGTLTLVLGLDRALFAPEAHGKCNLLEPVSLKIPVFDVEETAPMITVEAV